jgi:hypothetical protein
MESNEYFPKLNSSADIALVEAVYALCLNDIGQNPDVREIIKALLQLGKRYGIDFADTSSDSDVINLLAEKIIKRAEMEFYITGNSTRYYSKTGFAAKLKKISTSKQKALPPGESYGCKIISIR